MTSNMFSLLFLFSCTVDNSALKDTSDPAFLLSYDTGVENSIVAELGEWKVNNPAMLSDSCSVGDYQDVKEMVPKRFLVEETAPETFQTDDTNCTVDSSGTFVCDPIRSSENALSGTATLKIRTTMKGKLESPTLMQLGFDVVIEECEGAGCFLINMALDFPCPVTLSAEGSL